MLYTNRSCCVPRHPCVGVVVGREKFYSSGETATLLQVKSNTFGAIGALNTNPCRSFGLIEITIRSSKEFLKNSPLN
jgi:hypothetical protein